MVGLLTTFKQTDVLSDRQHIYRSEHSTTFLTRNIIQSVIEARETQQEVVSSLLRPFKGL